MEAPRESSLRKPQFLADTENWVARASGLSLHKINPLWDLRQAVSYSGPHCQVSELH
jgi:hypothetical protein